MDTFKIFFLAFMFILGACLGSFACCQARRLRAREKGHKISSKRSICEHCKKQLSWYENLPLLSWLFLKGRCKKCQKKIGLAEPLSELGLALALLALGFKFWPSLSSLSGSLPFVSFIILIIIFTSLAICFIYDALWGSFPSIVLYITLAFSAIFLVLEFISLPISMSFTGAALSVPSLLAGIGILPGVYYLLYFFSREKLVGSGDWLLCLSLALVLHNFWLCFFVLFLSNFLACLVGLPLAFIHKEKNLKLSFGPFLILAFLIVYTLSDYFIVFL